MKTKPDDLTQKQWKFVLAYNENNNNATQAAITAGYSKKTAGSQGCDNLKKPNIKKYIVLEEQRIYQEHEEAEKMAVEKLIEIIDSDTTDFICEGIPIVPTAIHKTGSKLKAIELLFRKFGLFNDKIDVNSQVEVKNPYTELTNDELNELISKLKGDDKNGQQNS